MAQARKVLRFNFSAVADLHLDLHGVAISADAQSYRTAHRRFADHSAQLLFAFNPGAVKIKDHIMLFQTGLACGGVLINHGYLDPALLFQLESADTV